MLQQTVYVVQRTWFDGPVQIPTTDFRGLFLDPQIATSTAHASAHALGLQKNSVIRTILLPDAKTYAFVTAGSLFWVRTVSMHLGGGPPTTTTATTSSSTTSASVILTAGIIGGTGNPNSRRGSEVNEGRVFLEQPMALRALQGLPMNLKTISSLSMFPILTQVPEDVSAGWRAWPLGGQTVVPSVPAIEEAKRSFSIVQEERPSKRRRGMEQQGQPLVELTSQQQQMQYQ